MKGASDSVTAIHAKIKQAAPLSQELLEAMRELPVPHQLALLRRYYRITQTELAQALGLKQGYFSRLEEEQSEHLLSHYAKAAGVLLSRLVLIPQGGRLRKHRESKEQSPRRRR